MNDDTQEGTMSMKKNTVKYYDPLLVWVYALIAFSLLTITVTVLHIINDNTHTNAYVEIVEVEDESLPGDDVEAVEPEVVEYPKLYTDEDAIALAKTLWGEARGVPHNGIVSGDCQRAAVIWTVLNRYDAGYADSIVGVVTAPRQFHGYSESHPIDHELLGLAYDVLDRWNREKHDEIGVGRVIPSDYFWFHGDGTYNHFRNEYESSETWKWELRDPYIQEGF